MSVCVLYGRVYTAKLWEGQAVVHGRKKQSSVWLIGLEFRLWSEGRQVKSPNWLCDFTIQTLSDTLDAPIAPGTV